jgi:hypothetical protein
LSNDTKLFVNVTKLDAAKQVIFAPKEHSDIVQ